jgi:hypothetical protein
VKLWLIRQNDRRGYDTFDSAVVAAETMEEAQCAHPRGGTVADNTGWYTWTSEPSRVIATLIGEATEGTLPGPICASFNAG